VVEPPEPRQPNLVAPAGATDQAWSIAPAGAGNLFGLLPVVPPPANLRCASGTKICVDTIGIVLLGFTPFDIIATNRGSTGQVRGAREEEGDAIYADLRFRGARPWHLQVGGFNSHRP